MKKSIITLMFLLSILPIKTFSQTDVITEDKLEATNESYKSFNNKSFNNLVKYSGYSAKFKTTLKLKESPEKDDPKSGIVTTFSEQKCKSIQIDWSKYTDANRSIKVFGKTEPYSSISDLYSKYTSKRGTLLCTIKRGDNKCYRIAPEYTHIGILAQGGTVYLNSIIIEWEKAKQPVHFAQSTYKVKIGNSFDSPTLTNTVGAPQYSSSDPGVATVNPQTGMVHIKNTGTTTISATLEETEKFSETTVQYKLAVQPNEINEVTFNFKNPSSLSTPYKNGDIVKNNISFVNKDAMVTIKDGSAPSRFATHYDETHLYLKEKGEIIIQLPQGLFIEKLELPHRGKNTGKITENDKIYAVGKITENYGKYTINNDSEIYASSLTVKYSGTYKIHIGITGYATFSSQHAYILPEGLKGGIVTLAPAQQTATARFCLNPGDIVAAQQGVILKGAPGEYTLRLRSEQGTAFAPQQNALRPVSSNNVITAPSEKQFLILAKTAEKGLGFYLQKGSNEGDQIKGLANKAYLEVPRSANITQGYKLELGEPTGIENDTSNAIHESNIFTISGIRINAPIEKLPQGFYIINGTKTFVK